MRMGRSYFSANGAPFGVVFPGIVGRVGNLVHPFTRPVAPGTNTPSAPVAAVIVYVGIRIDDCVVIPSGNLQCIRVDLLVQFFRLVEILFRTLRIVGELRTEAGNFDRRPVV